MTATEEENEKLRALLNDEQYILARALYAKGQRTWAGAINSREARAGFSCIDPLNRELSTLLVERIREGIFNDD